MGLQPQLRNLRQYDDDRLYTLVEIPRFAQLGKEGEDMVFVNGLLTRFRY